MKLRPYQQDIVDRVRAAMRSGHKRILVTLPTGGGKTVIARHIISSAIARGTPCWFTAHRDALINQAYDHMHQEGLEPAVFKAGRPADREALLQICSVQTVSRRVCDDKPLPGKPRLLFIDECHHVASDQWNDMFVYAPDAFTVGLTATAFRSDGQGLGVFDALVEGPTPRELVGLGVLVHPEMYTHPTITSDLTGDPVETWMEHAKGLTTVAFCTNKEHAGAVADQYREAGVPAGVMTEETSDAGRALLIEQLRQGIIKVLCNVEVLTEGFDLPVLECVQLLRRTHSESLYVQMVGRLLRQHDDAPRKVLLDHGSNLLRLGHPLSYRKADLSKGRQSKPMEEMAVEDRVKVCTHCYACMPGTAKTCPKCGSTDVPPLPVTKRRQRLEKWDGRGGTTTDERMRYLLHLERTRHGRGYNPWWSTKQYKNRYGVDPHRDQPMWRDLEEHQRVRYLKDRGMLKRKS